MVAALEAKAVDEGGSTFSSVVSLASTEEDNFPDNQAAQSEEESLALFDGEVGDADRFYKKIKKKRNG